MLSYHAAMKICSMIDIIKQTSIMDIFKQLSLFLLIVLPSIINFQTVFSQTTTTINLRVEHLEDPLGIDIPNPCFSWNLDSEQRGTFQSAYQIQLVDAVENFTEPNTDKMWDTGKVTSPESINVIYAGKYLEPFRSYYWRARTWNEKGEAGNWSKIAKFHVGPMDNNDWNAQWIGASNASISSPLFRREFQLTKPVKEAFVYIIGLGYYELYLNGEKVGDHVLDPGTTNYNKRVLYETYDVTDYFKSGNNAIGVWLGNGWFKHFSSNLFPEGRPRPYSEHLQLLFQLHIKHFDGSITKIGSDENWKTSDSPIVENSIYDGEIYDARKEIPGWNRANFDDSNWKNAVKLNTPNERIIDSQLTEPMRVVKTIRPVRMWEPIEGIYVYDFGQNITGWPRLRVSGGEGGKVVLRTSPETVHSIALMKESSLIGLIDTIDVAPNRSAKARNIYVLKGDNNGEEYEPRFTYQGFRYVQIEGYPGKPDFTSLDARVVHSDVSQTGEFASSNELINQIHQNIIRGQLGNLHSIPTDTPHRDERLGWLGDAHLIAEEAIYNFDMYNFFAKWLLDIKDSQMRDGSVPDYVPHATPEDVGTPAWQVAYPLIVYYLYHYYGNTRIVEEHFSNLERWMEYMHSISDNFIIKQGRGDWVPPRLAYSPIDGSIPITSTGYYYASATIMAQLAGVTGNMQKQQSYSVLAENIKRSFNDTFLDKENSIYGTGSQTSMAFPLYVGIVPEKNRKNVADNLAKQINIDDNGLINTGILGTKALVNALPQNDMNELLYELTSHTEYPGWGYMVAKGATTLWERWGGYRYFDASMNSLNHIMFGSIAEFFYKNIAGIEPSMPGYKEIKIAPQIVGDLKQARASIRTVYGKVSLKWKKQGSSITFDIIIPANTQAKLLLPKPSLEGNLIIEESDMIIWKNGQLISLPDGIDSIQEFSDNFEIKVLSGSYIFKLLSE